VNVISKRGLSLLLKGFPNADQVGEALVFNIRANRYRLIATVFYPARTIYLKALLTHKEYDREEWKKWA
jgi:mRNA interferase HigB